MKFEEMETFPNVIQPDLPKVYGSEHNLKGKWNKEVFPRAMPLVLELGCGKGEYTVALAQMDPGRNYLGVDIKGARIWSGAKRALELNLGNVRFLRTRIEMIGAFFDHREVDEIWLTFPDPQSKRRRRKKRLTSASFLNTYRRFLKDQGTIHLKTDHPELYQYTLDLLAYNEISPTASTPDLYHSETLNDALAIRTYYENKFLEEGKKIFYVRFPLRQEKEIKEIPDEER